MLLTPEDIERTLVANGTLPSEVFLRMKERADSESTDIGSLLLKEGIASEEQLYRAWSEVINVPFVDLVRETIDKDVLFLVPEDLAKQETVVAFRKEGDGVSIAMADPLDLQTIESLKKTLGLSMQVYLAPPDSIRDTLAQYRRGLQVEFNEIIEQTLSAAQANEEDLAKMAQDLPFIKIVDTIVDNAIVEGASDIHIEPMEQKVVVRFRIDGILQDMIVLPKPIYPGVVARIKILTSLKIDEHRLPQDGRFKIEREGYRVSFRVSIMPVFDGEKIVMRLLNEGSQILTLEQLGFQHSVLEIVKRNVAKPHGMILVTGPTGSGKTTTLYSVMNVLNQPGVNIATVEDPIEYRMPRINQSQVRAKIGFTFASGLRSLVRQDPDIIMVGEIRDAETAETAIHSALTGHLLLSTLHTNSAAGSMPRLIDMGIKPFLIASTANMVIAQRLVRRICTDCMERIEPEQAMLNAIEKEVDVPHILSILERERIIEKGKTLKDLPFSRGTGCKSCGDSGYKGRIGIYEVLEMDEDMKDLVTREATSEEIQEAALKKGMITMIEDGFIKIVTGVTTLEEILRVTNA
ncbi:MAG: type II/IV secretion system protein [Candidatus Doudnabacteria bacterium]|nr:type II/IV secretion system protein [Candidatus Doudnabacteria bacterium]